MTSREDQVPSVGPNNVSPRPVSKLLSEVGLYGLGRFLARLMGVASTAVLARLLTVAQFGQLDFLQTLATLGVVFFSLQTEAGLLRLYHTARDRDRGTLLTTHLVFLTAVGLVVVPVTWVAAAPLARLLLPTAAAPMPSQFIAPLILSGLWFNHVFVVLRTSRRAKSAVVFSSLVSLVQIVLAVPLALWWGVAGVLVARVAAETLGSGFVVVWYRREYVWRVSLTWLRRLVRFSLPLLPNVAAQGILGNMTRYLLIAFWGAASLGLFSVAFRVSLIIGVFVGALKTAWLPYAFSREAEGESEVAHGPIYQTYLKVMTLLTLGVMVFAVDVIRVVAGADYVAAAPVAGLLCASVLFQGSIFFLKTPFMSRERTVPIMVAFLVGGLLAAGCSVLLIPRWGLPAAAAIQMVSDLTVNLVLYAWLRLRLKIDFPVIWLVVICLGVSGLTWLVTPWLMGTSFWLRLAIGLGLGVAGLLILSGDLQRLGLADGWRGLARGLLRRGRA
jgi:O-antigen/teichoic acid export membrane protein